MTILIYVNAFLSTSTIVFAYVRKEVLGRTKWLSKKIYWSQKST